MARPWILEYDTENCTIGAAVSAIGEKWTFLVLREAFNGVRRFEDMRRRTQAPRQVLSDRLSRLVADGMLYRVPYQERGQRVRHEYRLTQKGLDLYPVLVALMGWGDKYAAGPAGSQVQLTHRDCGAGILLQLACTDGHVLDSPREVTPLPGPGARKIA
jgi:DNA-binding HxlR family transcriptional regulator